MNAIETKAKFFAAAAAAVLALGASAASAQGFTPPNTDIRALEAPVDVTANQLNAFRVPVHQGRSVARDGNERAAEGPDQDR